MPRFAILSSGPSIWTAAGPSHRSPAARRQAVSEPTCAKVAAGRCATVAQSVPAQAGSHCQCDWEWLGNPDLQNIWFYQYLSILYSYVSACIMTLSVYVCQYFVFLCFHTYEKAIWQTTSSCSKFLVSFPKACQAVKVLLSCACDHAAVQGAKSATSKRGAWSGMRTTLPLLE